MQPKIRAAPERVRGFRIRIELQGTEPPVWRRLEVPGSITLDRLHVAVQAAMGWSDEHLHRFRAGAGYSSPYFVTQFDQDDGEEGISEDDVRLDQLLSRKGSRLWYEYDFGDGWNHVLTLEAVTDDPPDRVRCIEGRMACPPENCGGVWGYAELAEWVRGGHRTSAVPAVFDDADDAREWLPPDWHPDRFDIEDAQASLDASTAEQVPVVAGVAELADRLAQRGSRTLAMILARPGSHGDAAVSADDAARLVQPFTELLELIGDGVKLTGAGRLPPDLVHQLALRTGIAEWWIGKSNREDQTWPVAQIRETARALGLVLVRKGTLAPTAAGRRDRTQPTVLWQHIVSRLPLGRTDFDRQAGWLTLAVVGSEAPANGWDSEIADLLLSLGWRVQGDGWDPDQIPVDNPTLDVLRLLSGWVRHGRPAQVDAAVGATARAVIRAG